MIRALGLSAALLLLAGCASPVVTRIDAAVPAPLPARSSFAVVTPPGDTPLAHRQAIDMVSAALTQRGWTMAGSAPEAGDHLLYITLSDRPATAALQAGDDAGKASAVIGPAPDRKTTKGCARRDHRLAIRLTDRVTGADVYSGSAAEYHCKAALDESLPHLVASALDGLDGSPGQQMVERAGVR
jgi:hypothetical protein